ncbi:MAG: M48 family metalloprotease, partial [Planctomycetota bacterium]
EPGINAFAAGYSPAEAVVGVTRGTLRALSREELQGVIAHEFSHIMNGDMRMNIRLIGVLFGIQLVAMIGYFILRFGSGGRHSSRRNDKGSGAAMILLIALGLLVLGSIGHFFARLIKASISRQREFLADASAVQFTRNPQGVAGALKMIGAHHGHALLQTPAAEEASHLFFGLGVRTMVGAFSTHPPLLQRIQRVEPAFEGDFKSYAQARLKTRRQRANDQRQAESMPTGDRPAGPFSAGMSKMLDRFPIDPAALLAGIGTISEQNVDAAHRLLGQVPGPLLRAAHEPFSARCVVFAFLLDDSVEVRKHQLETIASREGDPSAGEAISWWRIIANLNVTYRLPVLEIVQGTLSGLSIDQYKKFRETCLHLIKADGRMDIFEFYLRHHILMHLDRRFQLRPRPRIDIEDIQVVEREMQLLLSALVQIGHNRKVEAEGALVAGLKAAGLPTEAVALRAWKYRDLEASLQQISRCVPAVKKQVLQAALAAMTHDQQITVKEAETFRAFAESIDCPVPPMVPLAS